MGRFAKSVKELDVYQNAFSVAMELFELIKKFPMEERFALTDQIRRSSRSVCLNMAEAWRKRRYKRAFIAKLSDCEAEAAETQISLDFAVACKYIDEKTYNSIYEKYEIIIGQIVKMIDGADSWLIK